MLNTKQNTSVSVSDVSEKSSISIIDERKVLETWHNLVVNPKDLPPENKIVLIKWKDDDYRVVRWLDSEKVFFDEITDDKFSNEYYPPIAWKEISIF